jgi:alpha-D-ribose 1-methylphosphonate 5-triphosphate diphosphatase
MFHSLSLYKITQAFSKPIRKKENVDRLISLIKGTHDKKHLIRHRFHARYEVDNVDDVDELIRYIEEGKVNMLSFMDHTPGQGQFSDIEGYKKMARSYRGKMSDEMIDAEIKRRQQAPKLTKEDCKRVADVARKHNVAIASHDDDTIEKLEVNKEFGTTISEFPISMDVAKKAHEMGFYTIAGTPNILLGGSHSGNLAAHEAIGEGVVDILCSDYYPASILHSVFKLHRDYGHDLVEMFKLITVNPAKAVNIYDQVGSIEKGKCADIVIIETIENEFPVITNCFVNGSRVLQVNYRD